MEKCIFLDFSYKKSAVRSKTALFHYTLYNIHYTLRCWRFLRNAITPLKTAAQNSSVHPASPIGSPYGSSRSSGPPPVLPPPALRIPPLCEPVPSSYVVVGPSTAACGRVEPEAGSTEVERISLSGSCARL